MEESKIKLTEKLGHEVWKILEQKHNIKTRRTPLGLPDYNFTQEELSLITSLELEAPTEGVLVGLENFPNLKSLKVETKAITAHQAPKDIASLGDKDIAAIENCSGLTTLSIINQAKVKWLDVSNLANLQDLTISHNQNLQEVRGMEELHDLGNLTIYGNNRMNDIEGLDKVILQNENLGMSGEKLSLDVLMFPNAIGYNSRTGEYNKEAFSKIQETSEIGHVNWNESLTRNEAITINTNQMIKLHNKSCEILEDNIPKTADKRDVIVGIEEYLAQNVKYDTTSLENGHTSYLQNGNDKLKISNGPRVGANGAYNALINNTSVCEGYTRGMQYLLKLKGIKSHNVDCYAGKDTTHMSDSSRNDEIFVLPDSSEYHSIICIDDYYGLYDDPCWNAGLYQRGDKSMPWLLKTKLEISEDHTLSFEERDINNEHLKQSPNVIQQSIQSNRLFRQTRLNSVKDTRRDIGTQVKGQIVKEGEYAR